MIPGLIMVSTYYLATTMLVAPAKKKVENEPRGRGESGERAMPFRLADRPR